MEPHDVFKQIKVFEKRQSSQNSKKNAQLNNVHKFVENKNLIKKDQKENVE